MSTEFKSKIGSIQSQIKELQEKIAKEITARKQKIGALAEKFELLDTHDELIAGLFISAKKAIKEKNSEVEAWVKEGKKYLESKRNKKEKNDDKPTKE